MHLGYSTRSQKVMITKTVMCPNCKNQIIIQGNLGEKTYITCSKCNTKGAFTFPGEKSELKTTSDSFILEVDNLTKLYNDLIAVDNLSFNVRTGEIFGLLGPNGAGKTTTIKAILGLIHTNSGKIKINGFDIKKEDIEADPTVPTRSKSKAISAVEEVITRKSPRAQIATANTKREKIMFNLSLGFL